ncbi:hypothetical protein [Promicromonospora sp. MEB111]|uniref:hypothetical protein n=1 Tax=Promicromonospora sp. MEB111 TaxID=3040301 RepID=UPI00254E3A4F|nr:hypothetical protein [Promicromonospora sp. MEB111]
MKQKLFGDAHPALAAPTPRTARRWRAGASLATLALVAGPFAAVPASAAEADAPVFTGTLAVSGAAVVGTTIALDQTGGTWAPEPESVAYAWYLSADAVLDATDTLVEGAGDPTLDVLPAYLDQYLIGTVAATAGGLTSDPVAAASGVVTLGDLAAGTPTVSGTVKVASKLTARPGTWPEGTSLAYQWKISGTTVATTTTFTPQAAHAGKTLRLVVTGTKAGYAPKTAYSAFSTVAKASFVTTTPKINGTVKVGGLVGATTGHFSPTATLKYQWKANGSSISGATSRTYTIPSRLHGDKLTVTVTGSKAGYTTKSLTSAAAVVSKPFARTSAPTISGTVRVGQTLTANRGTWSPTPSVVTYQWRANGTPIAGATSRTYKLTTKEHGKKISVEIVGRKYAYLPAKRLSSATVTVKWPVGISTPNVTTQPTRYVDTTVGKTVTLKVSATGGGLKYQWQRWTPASGTWTNIGSNSSTYRFTAAPAHELNQFRVVVSNMAGKDTSNRTYLWVRSSLSSPFAAYQWFSLWNYNAAISESYEYAGYLTADVGVCAAPGYYPTGDISVQFVGSNGHVYAGAGQEQPDHISWGVPLDSDGCGFFRAYTEAPRSVWVGGRWRITDRSDGQVYHQYVKYDSYEGTMSARTLAGSGSGASQLGSLIGSSPVVGSRASLTD